MSPPPAPVAKGSGTASASSSSAGAGAAPKAHDDDDVEFVRPIAARPAKAARPDPRDFKPAAGGGEIFYEDYVDPHTGKMYSNWIFKCHRCPKSAKCERTKGCVPTNMHHGFLEPLAFLHVWHDTPPGKKGHRLTAVNQEDVIAYLNTHKDELQAEWHQFATP